ncbi:hypothetical protein RJ639_001375 [Escallonia herrerae]|uniref:GAG-pre-integrase domain-containing protein n=1 Tax=Escallonia herrerae TaxID=1293975 RepID=A0AA88XDL5_9ASTE|nr:hypothetical protein RJ639_001375 [Escallonia herrerae]
MYDGIGSTVTRAAATASFSDIDSDATKLWHTRLGHMSERGMDVQGLLGSKKIEKLDFCEHCAFEKQYMLTFIDEFSIKVWVYILKKKSNVFVQWKQFKMMIEKQTGKEIKCLRTDNDMEFCLDEFIEDVTFDESSILSKKELIDAGKDHGVKEKVELKIRAPDSLPIIPIDEEDGSHSTEKNEKPQE